MLYKDPETFYDNLFFKITSVGNMKVHVYYKNYTFILIVKSLYFAMLNYRGHEKLTPIYNNCSGTSEKELSQFGRHIFNLFSNIANCFWKGVLVYSKYGAYFVTVLAYALYVYHSPYVAC